MQRPVFIALMSDDLVENLRIFPILYYLKQSLGPGTTYLHSSPNCQYITEWAICNNLAKKFNENEWRENSKTIVLDFGVSKKLLSQLPKSLGQNLYQKKSLKNVFSFMKSKSIFVDSDKRSSHFESYLNFVQKILSQHHLPVRHFVGCPRLKVPSSWLNMSAAKAVIAMSSTKNTGDWNVDHYLDYAKKVFPEYNKSVDILVDGDDARMRLQSLKRSGVLDWGVRIVEKFADCRQKIAYLSKAKFVVSGNTDSLHLANSLGKDIYGIYSHKKIDGFWRQRPHGYWHSGFFRYQIIS